MYIHHLKVIHYITDMSKQMSHMACRADSPLLALLLDMVAKEGESILNDTKTLENNENSTKKHNHRNVE